MKKIAILGCGWLGLPLAKSLISNNFEVSGSTTTAEKVDLLQKYGIKAFVILLTENEIKGDVAQFLTGIEILIIDIPPKLRSGNKENFVQKITNFISYIEKSTVRKVIFISSTSVFDDDNSIMKDGSVPNSKSEAGIQLYATEKLLQNNQNFDTTIIRFGGLVGGDRHPAKMLAGRSAIENPDAPINLIHQEDCIEIIQKVIQQNEWNTTFNAVSPFHPTKETYYKKKTIDLNLPIPTFDHSKPSKGKEVKSDFVIKTLGHQFLWTNNI